VSGVERACQAHDLCIGNAGIDASALPNGVHMLVKPWERLASQQGTVDWFAFWLKHEKDPSPAKVEQYERWEELRGLEDQIDQAHYVPLGR
jgi:hypothetical protein